MTIGKSTQDIILLVGRMLLAVIFVLSGYAKITNFNNTAVYMAHAGLPQTDVLLILSIIIELGGGLLIAVGWQARWAALVIFLYIIPVTLVFHAFWTADSAHFQSEFNNFFKNIAIMGGMAYVFAVGTGAYGIDNNK